MNYNVTLNFNDGDKNYDLPLVQSVDDSPEGIKATVIEGKRGDGAIVIPGGKKSRDIIVKGILTEDESGYVDLATKIQQLQNNITTNVATLTLKYYNGEAWVVNWARTVRRIEEIYLPESLRTNKQNYEIKFKILAY